MSEAAAAPRPRRPARRALALLGGLGLALGLAEGALRGVVAWREDLTPPPAREVDPYGENPFVRTERRHLYFHLPGARYRQVHPDYRVDYRINARGFRGPEPGAKRGRRLVVAGDSIVEGHGVEDGQAFPALLGPALAGWEVVNAGVQGASPIYYAANLPRLLALEPDAVLVVCFPNDLAEDRLRELGRPRRRRLLTAPWRLGTTPRPACLLRELLWPAPDPLEPLLARHAALARGSSREEEAELSGYLAPPERFEALWSISRDWLEFTAERLDAAGVPLLLAWLTLDFAGPERGPAWAAQLLRQGEALQAWADARRLPLLRLDRRFAAEFAGARPGLVFPHDPHPSPAGQAALAEALGPWLRERLAR